MSETKQRADILNLKDVKLPDLNKLAVFLRFIINQSPQIFMFEGTKLIKSRYHQVYLPYMLGLSDDEFFNCLSFSFYVGINMSIASQISTPNRFGVISHHKGSIEIPAKEQPFDTTFIKQREELRLFLEGESLADKFAEKSEQKVNNENAS